MYTGGSGSLDPELAAVTSGNSEGAPGAEGARRGVRVGEVLAHSQSSRSCGLPWLSDS